MIEELKLFIRKIEDFERLTRAEQIDFFAHFFIFELKGEFFTAAQIKHAFELLRLLPHSNIPRYLNDNSNKTRVKRKKIKFLKTRQGFHFLSAYEIELKEKIKDVEVDFMSFSVTQESLDWKPSDIPFLTSKIKKNAEFFSKLYFFALSFRK